MVYNIIISPRAQREVKNAINYYKLHSIEAPQNFVSALTDAYALLEVNPFFKVRYKSVRALKVHKFPYLLYFHIDTNDNTVKVLACFHTKLSPDKRPGL